jgi:hypothetical protein
MGNYPLLLLSLSMCRDFLKVGVIPFILKNNYLLLYAQNYLLLFFFGEFSSSIYIYICLEYSYFLDQSSLIVHSLFTPLNLNTTNQSIKLVRKKKQRIKLGTIIPRCLNERIQYVLFRLHWPVLAI